MLGPEFGVPRGMFSGGRPAGANARRAHPRNEGRELGIRRLLGTVIAPDRGAFGDRVGDFMRRFKACEARSLNITAGIRDPTRRRHRRDRRRLSESRVWNAGGRPARSLPRRPAIQHSSRRNCVLRLAASFLRRSGPLRLPAPLLRRPLRLAACFLRPGPFLLAAELCPTPGCPYAERLP